MIDSVACSPEQFDLTLKYVRVTDKRADGFIEFDYCLGEKDMVLEMILTEEAFEDFCRTEQVTFLDADNNEGGEASPFDWRLHNATHNFSANDSNN